MYLLREGKIIELSQKLNGDISVFTTQAFKCCLWVRHLVLCRKNTTSYTNMLRIYGQNGSSTELTEVGKGQHSVLVQVKRFIGPFQESSTVPLGCSKPSVPVCT